MSSTFGRPGTRQHKSAMKIHPGSTFEGPGGIRHGLEAGRKGDGDGEQIGFTVERRVSCHVGGKAHDGDACRRCVMEYNIYSRKCPSVIPRTAETCVRQ